MRTDLDHLPTAKRLELAFVTTTLLEAFESRRGWDGKGKVLKIILYGSYARGDWVDDRKSGYRSDYDLLVIVDDEERTDYITYWESAEDKLIEALAKGQLSAEVNFIVHSLADVNEQLSRGRYFFADILAEGILLHDMPGHDFIAPQPLKAEVARQEAQEHFSEWFGTAGRYFVNAKDNIARGWNKEAAFLLHQATERYYHCLLLTLTLYAPHTHKLNWLRSQAEDLDPRLITVWPRTNRRDRARFEKLRRAYIEARYSRHYQISTEELEWLAERIERLCDLIAQICRERLEGPIEIFSTQRPRRMPRSRKTINRLWDDQA